MVALGYLAETALSLIRGTLIEEHNAYAAAALVRQLVEIEYLAWAIAEDHQEAAAWLRRLEMIAFNVGSPDTYVSDPWEGFGDPTTPNTATSAAIRLPGESETDQKAFRSHFKFLAP